MKHHEEPYEVIGRRADGTSVEIEVFPREITYEKDPNGVAVVRDMTEQKKIEKMLEREKNAIMGNAISHSRFSKLPMKVFY